MADLRLRSLSTAFLHSGGPHEALSLINECRRTGLLHPMLEELLQGQNLPGLLFNNFNIAGQRYYIEPTNPRTVWLSRFENHRFVWFVIVRGWLRELYQLIGGKRRFSNWISMAINKMDIGDRSILKVRIREEFPYQQLPVTKHLKNNLNAFLENIFVTLDTISPNRPYPVHQLKLLANNLSQFAPVLYNYSRSSGSWRDAEVWLLTIDHLIGWLRGSAGSASGGDSYRDYTIGYADLHPVDLSSPRTNAYDHYKINWFEAYSSLLALCFMTYVEYLIKTENLEIISDSQLEELELDRRFWGEFANPNIPFYIAEYLATVVVPQSQLG